MRAHQEKHRSSKSPGVPLLEAGLNQCRFIVSEAHRPVLFCGRRTSDGCSWCEQHRLVVYPPRAMQGGRPWRTPRTFGHALASYTYLRIRDEGLTTTETSTLFGIKVAQRVREMEEQGSSGGALADWVEVVARTYAERLDELLSVTADSLGTAPR